MSKFDKIFEAREEEKEVVVKPAPASTTKPKFSPQRKQKQAPNPEPLVIADSSAAKKRGRPTAKRSDPLYVGFTTYILKSTHTKAKIALLQEGKSRELSELVEQLMSDWIKKQ